MLNPGIYFVRNGTAPTARDLTPTQLSNYLKRHMMSETTYHKAQIIPGNDDTWVYWLEKNGRAMDIRECNLPKNRRHM